MTATVAAYLAEAVEVEHVGAALPPSPTFPALRITEVSTNVGDQVDEWVSSFVQIDVFADSKSETAALAGQVVDALIAAANWVGDGVVLGRAEVVRTRPMHDTSFDPPQPRWFVTGRMFAKPT